MKRLLLSLFCVLSVAIASFAAEEVVATLKFGSDYNSGKISSYTNTWSSTVDGITWDIAYFNNNNNDWDYIKGGNKTAASIPTITNQEPFAAAISKVTVTIDALTTASVNSIKLYVSTNNSFPADCDSYDITKAKGDQTVYITNPIANAYYKIAFDCAKGSDNGLVKVSQVQYFAEAGAIVISGLQEEYSVAVDGTIDLEEKGLYVSPEDAVLSYEVTEGDTDGLSFNGNVITANKVGEYTVTLIGNAGGSDQAKTFKVNVTKKLGKLSFSDQIVYGKLGIGVLSQTVIVKEGDADATIKYTSDDPENLIVDPVTGEILSDNLATESGKKPGVQAAGEYFVIATMAESANYAETSACYKVVILDPSAAIIVNGFDEFDFTTKDPYGIPTLSSSYVTGDADTTEIDASKNNELDLVSISFVTKENTNGYRSWQSDSKYDLRVYKGTDMIFSVPDGYVISQIGLAGSKVYGTFDPEEGGEHQDFDGIPSASQLKSHWHAGANQKLRKVTLKITDKSYIDKIYVLYEADNSNLKPAELSFNQTYYGVYYQEPATLNAVSNPHNLPVIYSIQNLDADKYTIVPSEDGKTIEVTLNVEPASYGELTAYTLEAKTAETDTYRTGYAIMRLNVYEHLNVYLNGKDCVRVRDGKEYIDASAPSLEAAQEDLYTCSITFDVPDNTNLYYKLNLDLGFSWSSEVEDVELEDGFALYEDGIDVMSLFVLMDPNANIEFYLGSYGYKSPKRTIALRYKYFNLPEGKFKYSGHDTADEETHFFLLSELIESKDFIIMRGDADDLPISVKIEPQFTPLRAEDLADYDKNNDRINALIYEDAIAELADMETYEDVRIYTKHAGLYKLTMTNQQFGEEESLLIEVEPNFTEPTSDGDGMHGIYLHGVALNKVGENTYTLDHAGNEKAHVDYIYTGHPTYGNDGQNGIWYKIDFPVYAQNVKGNKPQFASAPAEDSADWTPLEKKGFDLIDENGTKAEALHLKLATNGVSKVQSFALNDFTTGVEVISAEEAGEAIYIDLNGVRVDNPTEGIYIRIANGKADKVMIVE